MHRPVPRSFHTALWLIAAALATAPVAAGSAREIARGMRVNQQQLQDFSWKSRAEIKIKGKTRHVELFEVRYDMDGGLLKTPIDDPASDDRRSRRGPGLEEEVRALADACAHLTPIVMKELFAEATLAPGTGEDADLVRVQAEQVGALGDKVDLWVDRQNRPRRSTVATEIDGRPVRIETEFARLDGGPAYPVKTTVHTEIKGRPATVEIHNFDFTHQGG